MFSYLSLRDKYGFTLFFFLINTAIIMLVTFFIAIAILTTFICDVTGKRIGVIAIHQRFVPALIKHLTLSRSPSCLLFCAWNHENPGESLPMSMVRQLECSPETSNNTGSRHSSTVCLCISHALVLSCSPWRRAHTWGLLPSKGIL